MSVTSPSTSLPSTLELSLEQTVIEVKRPPFIVQVGLGKKKGE